MQRIVFTPDARIHTIEDAETSFNKNYSGTMLTKQADLIVSRGIFNEQ
jgi:hypothetical protein